MPEALLAPGALTDVAGLAVGHAAARGRPTGCTVVLCPQGATCGVAVRGSAPGTRETDLLRPEATVQQVHGVLLTGGSAFGLDAATGVVRWLEERGHGLPVGAARVPIVPAAVLFDLWLDDARIRPDAALGYAACEAAGPHTEQGSVGAGLGATIGKLWGVARAMRGGVGTASLKLGNLTVAALAAVNAVGDVIGAEGRVIAGARSADGTALQNSTATLLQGGTLPPRLQPGTATTLAVVATDAVLDKAQATQLASLAHHGLARAVSPITTHDGDTVFALGTGASGRTADATLLGTLAAEVLARAVRNAAWSAQGLSGEVMLPAARDLLPPH